MPSDAVDHIVQAWAKRDPALDVSPLHVVGRLLLCADHLDRVLVAALQPFRLSFGDFDVINTLRRRADEHGAKPSELAQSSLITTGAMTSRLDRLQHAGLVTRAPDPTDGRGVLINLTARGEALAEQSLHAVLDADRTFLEPLSDTQRDSVAAALKLLLLHFTPE